MKLFAIVNESNLEPYGIYMAESPETNAMYVSKVVGKTEPSEEFPLGQEISEEIEMAHCEVLGGQWIPDRAFTVSEDDSHYHTLEFLPE